jgi:hypothetical protein
MRVTGWERALRLVVEKHLALPSAYGVSDCFVIPDDGVEAVTGAQMYPGARGYKTPAGAAKKLRKHGFLTVEDAFAAKFARIPVSMAQRGDIGVVYQSNGEVTGGVFTGTGFLTRAEDRAVFLPHSAVTHAFRVD